ncbi:amidase [Nocardia colli]|uniref:amidase n=1 Tax=Nocardia colli TaxID=2545717 RepID=UPI0035D6AB03
MKIPPGSVHRIRSRTYRTYQRRVAAQEVIQETLTGILRVNNTVHAFSYVDAVGALSYANKMDRHTPHGAKPLPLIGVPFAVADLDDCLGMPSRYGSPLYQDVRPSAVDSPVVRRLRAAGAIPVGKTAVSEFGWGQEARTDAGAVTRNPWHCTRSPGGGSGGAAVAVAAGLVPFAIGSHWHDGIRVGAAHCGLVGFKPSQGLVPSSGQRTPGNYGGNLQCVGILTTSVADAALVLESVAGPASYDRESLAHLAEPYVEQLRRPVPPAMRIGWLSGLGGSLVDLETRMFAHEVAGRVAAAIGGPLEVVRPDLDDLGPLTVLAQVGLAATLAAAGLLPRALRECEPDVRAAIAGVVDPGDGVPGLLSRLARADQCRAQVQTCVMDVFERSDVLLTMYVSGAAPAADYLSQGVTGEVDPQPRDLLANACWLPAASVPIGFSAAGLPIGLQIIARYGQDSTVLSVARVVEQVCSRWWDQHETMTG